MLLIKPQNSLYKEVEDVKYKAAFFYQEILVQFLLKVLIEATLQFEVI